MHFHMKCTLARNVLLALATTMKTKKKARKLSLRHETLRRLSSPKLDDIRGALGEPNKKRPDPGISLCLIVATNSCAHGPTEPTESVGCR